MENEQVIIICLLVLGASIVVRKLFRNETLNEKLSIIIDKMISESTDQDCKQELKKLKINFNSFVSRLNYFLEKLDSIEYYALDKYIYNDLDVILNTQGKILKHEAEIFWGNSLVVKETLKSLSKDINNDDYKKLKTLWQSDIYNWSWQISVEIEALELLNNKDVKFDNGKFNTLIDDFKKLLMPMSETEKQE
jgi:hypothetical protein